jgi:hypothetical protein
MLSQEEIESYRERLVVYRRNLSHYLHQEALNGLQNMSPSTINGIVEVRKNIRYVKAILRNSNIPVIDHPDDEPANDREHNIDYSLPLVTLDTKRMVDQHKYSKVMRSQRRFVFVKPIGSDLVLGILLGLLAGFIIGKCLESIPYITESISPSLLKNIDTAMTILSGIVGGLFQVVYLKDVPDFLIQRSGQNKTMDSNLRVGSTKESNPCVLLLFDSSVIIGSLTKSTVDNFSGCLVSMTGCLVSSVVFTTLVGLWLFGKLSGSTVLVILGVILIGTHLYGQRNSHG